MVRLGVVGYGYWGPNLARNFSEADGAELTMVSDSDPGRMAVAAKRYPAVRTVLDYRELIDDRGIDAVAVATPVSTHFEIALAALEAGKHVLVEKPLAATSEHARRLVEAARAAGLTLMVDHIFPYTAAVRKLCELVGGGELGDIYYYDALRVNLGQFQNDVDVLWDLAVHDLSILDCVIAERPSAIAAHAVGHLAGKPDDVGYVTLFFDSGAIAHINVNWLAPVKLRRILIGGSRKMIVYDELEPSEKVKIFDRGVRLTGDPEQAHKLQVDYRIGGMAAPHLDRAEPLRTAVGHFIDCIETGETPLTDGMAGLRIVEMLEAAAASVRQGGRRLELKELRKAS